jgi:membrane dipeptidase
VKLFDLHCDTLDECFDHGGNLALNHYGVSLETGRALENWAQVFAIWIPYTLSGDSAWAYYQGAKALFRRELAAHESRLTQVCTGAELNAALAAGKCAGILAVENASAIGGDLRRLEQLAHDGVKILTLTWNGENEVACGALHSTPRGGGLKPFGRQLLRELSALNIAADVSHLNARSFWDAMQFDVPIIASHSNCRAVYDHPRALSDAQIRALVDRGAPVGLTFAYLRSRQGHGAFAARRDRAALYKNTAHFLQLGAQNTLCLGTDYDGTPAPQGLETTNRLPLLRDCLSRRGVDNTTLENIFFGNAYRWFMRTF